MNWGLGCQCSVFHMTMLDVNGNFTLKGAYHGWVILEWQLCLCITLPSFQCFMCLHHSRRRQALSRARHGWRDVTWAVTDFHLVELSHSGSRVSLFTAYSTGQQRFVAFELNISGWLCWWRQSAGDLEWLRTLSGCVLAWFNSGWQAHTSGYILLSFSF